MYRGNPLEYYPFRICPSVCLVSEDGLERRLTTILSADVVGYSRLVGQDEAGTVAALKTLRKVLVEPKLAQYHGRIVKLMGDGALMEFSSVVDAVVFAVELQSAMQDRNNEIAEDRQIIYRIGINIGDIIVEGDDIHGDGVNVAARLEGLAEPGGICASRTVINHVKGKVELNFEDLGDQEVKNIAEPVRVYRVVLDDKAAALVTPLVETPLRVDPPRGRQIAAAVAIGLIVVGGLIWWQPWGPEFEPASAEKMALPLPDNPSIAVLPFDNMSGDAEQDYFSDGMTEDLITDLSKVPGLFVISRNSTFTYKGKPVEVRQVAEDLGVRYVLEGSVRRAGDDVRINAQLIDALSGYHVWADRFDEPLADIFALQDKVVGEIVSALAINIKSAEAAELAPVETDVAEAYDAFLEGWELYRRHTPEDTIAAIGHFEKAIELDPEYGRAYAGLAASYWLIADAGWESYVEILWQEAFDLAKDYLIPALARPTSTAHLVSAGILRLEGKIEEALDEIDKAIALEPNNADSYVSKAQVLIYAGRVEEAEQSARLAMRMNPHYEPDYLKALGRAVFYQGRYEEAAKILERVIKRQPERGEPYMRVAAAYGHLGRLEDAKAAVSQYDKISAKTGYTPLTVQEASLWYEDTSSFLDKSIPEPLFEGLRKSGVPEGAAPEREGFDFKALVTSTYGERGRSYEVTDVQKIEAAAVKEMLEDGTVLIDVRDAGSHGRGRIPGAVHLDLNIALTEESLMAVVDKNDPVIFHCWGPSCSYSAMACAKARLWGYTSVYYFAGGFPAWKAAGYPIEKTDSGS
jgi:TolB-like protein/class 3 adenylate cyclase/rhodanese-related sulfurtransferase